MTSLKRLLRIKTLLLSTLYLLMTQVVVGQSPAASVKAGASFKEAGQVREKGEVNAASALFGPWGDAASLRAAIIDRLKRQIDEEPYHQTEADIMLGITIAEAKGRAKEYIEKEDCLLAREAFEKVSAGLAKVLNGWLREQIFSPQDFLPIDDDFPKGRNVDPNNSLNYTNKDKWMTINEYINNTYLRVVRKVSRKFEERARQ